MSVSTMDKQATEVSPEREELQRHILPRSQLEYCHERYPGTVGLVLVRRTRAVVLVHNRPLYFHLTNEALSAPELEAEGYVLRWLKERHPALWGLAQHLACEAMLAVRNGHKEHVRTTRKKREQATQKADVS